MRSTSSVSWRPAAASAAALCLVACGSSTTGGEGGTPPSSSITTTNNGSSSAVGGAGGAASSSSSSGIGGAGGAASSSSSSGIGGAGGAASSSSSGGVGGAGGAASSSSSGGVGGAGGAASSSSSSSSTSASSTSSSSSASSSGAIEVLDCAPLAGAGPGAVLWSTTFSVGPYPTARLGIAAGSTGRSFVTKTYRVSGGGDMPAGVQLHEVDGSGSYVGLVTSLSGLSQSAPASNPVVWGARHWIIGANFYGAGLSGSVWHNVESDNGSASAQGIFNFSLVPYTDLQGLGNAAGDLFIVSAGVMMPGALKRIDSAGVTAYDKPMPATPVFANATPDEAGNAYLAGDLQGTVDFGCGPLGGAGAHVTKLDPLGACVWSRNAGATSAVVPTAGGAYLTGTFTGTLDLGCGPLTSAGTASYMAQVDAAGACQWSRALQVPSLSATLFPSGALLVSGVYTGTADVGCGAMTSAAGVSKLVAQINASGTCVWSRSFDATKMGALTYGSGDVMLNASINSPVDFGGGPVFGGGTNNMAVARLDGATGQHVWSKGLGGVGASVSGAAYPAPDGGALVVATASGTVDFGGGPISTSAPPKACVTDADCPNAMCLGTQCTNPFTVSFALKLDANGGYRWQRTWVSAALDGCGAAMVASVCTTCGPGGGNGVTVERVAP